MSTTFHATPFDGAPTSRKRHIRPDDVTIPRSLDECEAALDLCNTNVVTLTDMIARRGAEGGPVDQLEGLLVGWEKKRAEVAYVEARLTAPAAKNDEPSIEIALARRRIADLEAALAKATRRPASLEPRAAYVAEVERQNRDLIAKNDRLSKEVASLHEKLTAKNVEAGREKHKRAVHDGCALQIAVICEMIDAGSPLTPLSAHVLTHATDGLPDGFLSRWRAHDLRFIEASARELYETNAVRAAAIIESERAKKSGDR